MLGDGVPTERIKGAIRKGFISFRVLKQFFHRSRHVAFIQRIDTLTNMLGEHSFNGFTTTPDNRESLGERFDIN